MVSSLSLGLAIPTLQTTFYPASSPELYTLYLFAVGVLLGSVFPDIDEPGSYIGRKFPLFSNTLSLFIKHRGITHTLLVLLFYVMVYYFLSFTIGFSGRVLGLMDDVFAGFIIGNIGHILGDMTTKSGVSLFYPLTKKNIGILPKSLRYYTGSPVEVFLVRPFFMVILLVEFFNLYNFYNGGL